MKYEYTWKYHMNIPESTIGIYLKVPYEYTRKNHTNIPESTLRIYMKVPYEYMYTWKYHTNIPESTIRIYPKVRYEYTWKYHTNMWICHTFFGCVIDLIWIKLYFIFDCTRFYSTVFDCTRKYHNLYSIILANIRLYVTLRLSHDVSV